MLRLRLIFGTTLAALALVLLGVDGYLSTGQIEGAGLRGWFRLGGLSTLLALAFALATARELIQMARARGGRPLIGVSYFFSVGFVIGPYAAVHLESSSGLGSDGWPMAWLALALTTAFVVQAGRSRAKQALGNIAATMFIIVYAGAMTGFLVRLRMEIGGIDGILLLVLSIFTLKMNDIGAFFVGRTFGRRKMIEWLSPKKTWEGFAGGLATAVLFSLTAGSILRYYGAGVCGSAGLIAFGLLMAIAAVIGDLCASLLKRDVELKDSGTFVPGMGGALDILDSLLIGGPPAWFFWTRLAAG